MTVVKIRYFVSGMFWTAFVFECHVVAEPHDCLLGDWAGIEQVATDHEAIIKFSRQSF